MNAGSCKMEQKVTLLDLLGRTRPFFLIIAGILLGRDAGRAESLAWTQAHELYQRTDYAGSLRELLAVTDKDAAVLQLIGQDYFMLGEYRKATEFLERAAALTPANAECFLWLGRAYGRRAETSNPFSAPGYASKARQMLERAVSLSRAATSFTTTSKRV